MNSGSPLEKILVLFGAIAIIVAVVGSNALPIWGDILFVLGSVALVIKYIIG